MPDTIDEILAEIQSRCDKATEGEWKWRRTDGSVELFNPRHGLLIIMDAVRKGMNAATLRFAVRTQRDKGGIMRTVDELVPYDPRGTDWPEPENPDMAFIAHSRTDVPRLLACVKILTDAERARRCGGPGYNECIDLNGVSPDGMCKRCQALARAAEALSGNAPPTEEKT